MLRHQLKKHLLYIQRSTLTRASPCSGLHLFSSFHSPASPKDAMKKEKNMMMGFLTHQHGPDSSFRSFSSGESTNVVVPSMGDSISEGTVVEWLKGPGEYVAEDEVIVVLETDKVSVDVRSSVGGILDQTFADVDATVLVGSPLASIIPGPPHNSETKDTTTSSSSDATSTGGPLETVIVPSMGDSISEGTVVEWLKGPGDYVNVDEVIVVLETDKVSVDVRSAVAGTLETILASVDEVVEIGTALATIQPSADAPSASDVSAPARASSPAVTPVAVVETPVAAATFVAPKSTPIVESASMTTNDRPVRREKMNRMRLRIAERLKESQNVAASLTTFQECDMGNLMALRKKYKDSFEKKHGVKLGFMSAFIKASSEALLEVPAVNAELDENTQELIFKEYVDMSVAVATPRGLVTPVLKDTHRMSFAEIELALSSLAERARKSEITVEEMTGGNFTISNGGVFGSLMGTPIINRPQSAILGMHATKMRPMVDFETDEIVARPMMYLALTYDHRIIDGREAVTCLKSIADKIQDPERLLLDL